MENFLVIEFSISPVEEGRDILLAHLDLAGFDSFEETAEGLKAYILEDLYKEEEMKQLPVFQSGEYSISYRAEKLENINWNEEWETNYAPIEIEDKIYIRAPFHPEKPQFPLQLEIMPKMSFGTGHHQTTRLMSRMILRMDLKGKKVLDMGTGTGILAIIAEKRGAATLDAIDNFDWAVENTRENCERNNCTSIRAELGDAELLKDRHYDVVLANINRNVLLEDMKIYTGTLKEGGMMALSGFFAEDLPLIAEEASRNGFKMLDKLEEKNWVASLFEKQ